MNLKFEYPHTWKWVLFSCLLVTLSIVFVLSVLRDLFSIFMYIIFTFIFTISFFFIKIKLYSKKTAQKYGMEAEEPASRRLVFFIILVLVFGVSLPFLLLLFVDPLICFLIITGFIAGINIPEIVIYIKYLKSCSDKKTVK